VYKDFNIIAAPASPVPISFRAASTYYSISTSTMDMTLTVPSSVQTSDVMVASIYAGDYLSSTLPVVTAPQGWTLVKQVTHGSAGLLYIDSRVAQAGEAGRTYDWQTDVWVGAACSLVAYANANSVSPVDVSAANDNATGAATYSTPPVTTTAANDLLLAVYAAYTSNGTQTSWGTPSGMTQRVNLNNTKLLSLSNDDKIQPAAGASGTFSATASVTQTYALTALVALKK